MTECELRQLLNKYQTNEEVYIALKLALKVFKIQNIINAYNSAEHFTVFKDTPEARVCNKIKEVLNG